MTTKKYTRNESVEFTWKNLSRLHPYWCIWTANLAIVGVLYAVCCAVVSVLTEVSFKEIVYGESFDYAAILFVGMGLILSLIYRENHPSKKRD